MLTKNSKGFLLNPVSPLLTLSLIQWSLRSRRSHKVESSRPSSSEQSSLICALLFDSCEVNCLYTGGWVWVLLLLLSNRLDCWRWILATVSPESMLSLNHYGVNRGVCRAQSIHFSLSTSHLAAFLEPDTRGRNSEHFNLWPKQKVLLIKI